MNLNAQWTKTYGGWDDDYPMDIKQTSDGGYVIAGWTRSFNADGEDVWILKLDKYGEIEWDYTYGGTGDERAFSIQQTEDGGYIVAADTDHGGVDSDYWILKLYSNGTREWQRTIGNLNRWESPRSIQQTSDGGYIVAGLSRLVGEASDVWIVKLSEAGIQTSQYIYAEGDVSEVPHSIQQTSDGGYIVAGRKRDATTVDFDAWVLKLPADLGLPTWQFTYGEAENDWALSVQETSDGGYIVAGGSYSYTLVAFDFWVLKLKSLGEVDWHWAYGYDFHDLARSIQQTEDGGYIAAGWTENEDGDFDFWVLKLKSLGEVDWQRRYEMPYNEGAHSIQQTNDGGYIVVGSTKLESVLALPAFDSPDGDIWVLKLYPDGDIDATCGFIKDIPIKKSSITLSKETTAAVGQSTGESVVTTSVNAQGTEEWHTLICEAPKYELEIDFGDGGKTVPGKGEYMVYKDEKVEVEAIPDDGYGFDKWTGDYPSGAQYENPITITMDVSTGKYIKALFKSEYTLTISVDPEEGGTTTPAAGAHTYLDGDKVPVTATAEDGYIFDKWTGDYPSGHETDNPITITMDADKTITANFIFAKHTLTIGTAEGGTTSPAGATLHDVGTQVPVTATPDEHYDFDKWTGDVPSGHETDNPVTITMDADKTITPVFVIKQYTLTIDAGTGGTTDPVPGTSDHDALTDVSVTAVPSTGYNFSGWSGDASGTDLTITITMNSDKSITASFTVIPTEDGDEEEDGEKKGGCFIATAAYDSPEHSYVRILRDFRDRYLKTNKLGRMFVDLYYEYSPFVANIIGKHKALKVAVRISLRPLVSLSYTMLHFGPRATAIGGGFIFFLIPIFFVWFYRGRVKIYRIRIRKAK